MYVNDDNKRSEVISFVSILNTFKTNVIFWGSSKIWLQPRTKLPIASLTNVQLIQICKTHFIYHIPLVYITNILRPNFQSIFMCQKSIKPNFKYKKAKCIAFVK